MYVNRLFELEDKIWQKHAGDYEAIRKARLGKGETCCRWILVVAGAAEADTGLPDGQSSYLYPEQRTIYVHISGRCSFSNNLSENATRPFVVGRKGWLFSDTQAGAETSAFIYTMVENAKANGVNIYQYLKLLLEKQPNNWMSDEELERFAPWDLEVKTLLDSRVTEELQNG